MEKENRTGTDATWRTWAISILVAIVLSVTATLLLGGSFLSGGASTARGSGSRDACCPPAGGR